jgi:formate dehydrogenase subunit gamma
MFRTISIVALAGMAVALVIHYVAFGLRARRPGKGERALRHLSLWDRLLQAGMLAIFAVLALSGLVPAVAHGAPLLGWWGVVHVAVAPAFAACVAFVTLTWAERCRFEAHDWEWAKGAGGYLGGKRTLPAGWFNAEQKAFVWVAAVLTIVLILSGLGRMSPILGATGQRVLIEAHRYAALLLTLAVVVHVYLSCFATRGGLLAAISGKVSAEWAKRYHPVWLERIQQQRTAEPEAAEPRPEQ